MKCPVCAEDTISAICHDESQGEFPWTGIITIVDEVVRECECVLTLEQEEWISDNIECSDGWDVD